MEKESRVYFYIAKINQFVSWPFIFIASSIFLKIRIKGKEKLRNFVSPTLIVANHIDFYDSFLFRLIFEYQINPLPLRFMATRAFRSGFLNFLVKIGVIDTLYKIFGVFVVVKGEGIDRGLLKAKQLINSNQNVVIYPQGMKIPDGVGVFKKGASVLAVDTFVSILPVSFKIKPGLFYRKEITISIGDRIENYHHLTSDDLNNYMYERVKSLYEQS